MGSGSSSNSGNNSKAPSESESNEKIALTYFSGKGRAEITRLILSAGNVDFDDIRIKGEEWPEFKATKTPFGVIPLLKYGDNFVMGESKAIARFAAKKAKLSGKDDLVAAKADMLVDMFWNYLDDKFKAIYGHKGDVELQMQGNLELVEKNIPKYLGNMEKVLKRYETKYLAGDEMTFADIALFLVVKEIEDENELESVGMHKERTNLLNDYPLVQEIVRNVGQNEGIRNYIKKQWN